MRTHVLVVVTAVLLLAAETQKEDAIKEQGLLTILEKQVLEAWKNRDANTLNGLLAENYMEIGGAGPGRRTKADVLKTLADANITDYAPADVNLVRLGRDAAILTYKLRMTGSLDGKSFSPIAFNVSSAWVQREGGWLSVFRHRTQIGSEGGSPQVVKTFDAALTPQSVRYLYKGTAKLEDINATIEVTLGQGKVPWQTYWGTWEPGEVKEVGLGFLASGVGAVERIDLSATATMGSKKVLCAASSRRRALISFDWRMIPPIPGLP